ncbi:MAG: A/G-specific adenine glycosylase [Bacteroidia bacterium]|nr:A/G-specific adenine glycosylase [Bacteroidia bacterium]
MEPFSQKIIAWYLKNKRDLPWRTTQNPYFIWLSEIILQQTRVDQGMAYYLKFVKEFPAVAHLAKADNEKVMKLWQGLGYYSRARNLHTTAKLIMTDYNGVFPDDYAEIRKLKGIGDYTAAAIASFAYNKPHAVVDGNVYRVLARVFGVNTPIDSANGKKEFATLAFELLDKKKPAIHNQAIMEFGALHCKPINPDCNYCPLQTMCIAFEKKIVSELPVKSKKTKVRKRFFNYIVFSYKNQTIINKRITKDIWTSLYDFPLFETETELTEAEFLQSKEWKAFIKKMPYKITEVSKPFKHVLSHQLIIARFWEIKCEKPLKEIAIKNALVIQEKNIHHYAIPRLIDNYLLQK